MAELLCSCVLWQGATVKEQWRLIVRTLGTPTTAEMHVRLCAYIAHTIQAIQPTASKRLYVSGLAGITGIGLNARVRALCSTPARSARKCVLTRVHHHLLRNQYIVDGRAVGRPSLQPAPPRHSRLCAHVRIFRHCKCVRTSCACITTCLQLRSPDTHLSNGRQIPIDRRQLHIAGVLPSRDLFSIIVLSAIEASYYTTGDVAKREEVCLIGSGTGTGNCTWTALISVLAMLTAIAYALLTVKVYQNYMSASAVAFAPTGGSGVDTAPYMGSSAPASFGDTYQDFTQPPLYNAGNAPQQQQQRVPY
ncbi:unnamed protein product [Sphagnum balticum]